MTSEFDTPDSSTTTMVDRFEQAQRANSHDTLSGLVARPAPARLGSPSRQQSSAAPEHPDHEIAIPDLEGQTALERFQSHISHMSQEDGEQVIRRLTSRHSEFDNGDPGSNVFTDLLGQIFDRDDMKKKAAGVYFEGLTVTGANAGLAVQPTVGDLIRGFMTIPKLPYLLLKSLTNRHQASASDGNRILINQFDGCVNDGEMLLVLGQPGSGCTTFLKALASLRAGFKEVTGDIHYGGLTVEQVEKHCRGEVVYNGEDDLHYATLSVEKTLRFALKARTPGDRPASETRKEYQDTFLDVLGKIFGIEHTFKTKVGDELIRGVSGGEKKRVSIAEVLVNRASVSCWDNSTRGLDSATAVEYCRSLRVMTNIAKVSSVVTIYQAGEQLYDFFDKVLLIDGGRSLYFGPAQLARQYFIDMGFEPEDRQTTADFLTAITDKRARKVREGANPPQSAESLELYYRKSEMYRLNRQDMEAYDSRCKDGLPAMVFRESQARKKHGASVYNLPFHKQVWYCTTRQIQVNFGDPLSLYGKIVSNAIIAIIVGTCFYDMPDDTTGAFLRGGVIFIALLFNSFLASAELSVAFSARSILVKHKSFTFFRPSALAIAQVIADIPNVAIQILTWNIITYFLAGLRSQASLFFFNTLVLYLTTLAIYSFFRMLGALVDSLDVATAFSGLALQALTVYAGYILPRPSMHSWLVWLAYISPLYYGFEAMMVNEFDGLTLQCVPPHLIPRGLPGQYPNQGCAIAGASPGSTTVSGAAYISSSMTYVRGHVWRNVAFLILFWIAFVVITCLGNERQKPKSSASGALRFKRGAEPKLSDQPRTQDDSTSEKPEDRSEHADSMGEFERSENTFTWSDVCYNVPDPANKGHQKQLLDHVSGWVKPGQLSCLVGSSGAGKTTLLNTLAQRQSTGVVTGEMLVDGRKLPEAFQRATGYVQQMDIHEPTATVREALQFSALLRQPRETPQQEKYAYVEEMIKLLEMDNIAEAVIGSPGNGLTIEQRKRLTLGVELVAKPSLLLFLDEPTSGLDSQAAWNIIRLLKKLAHAGQAILVTIHQPSSILFQQFERILLLGPGGKTIYFGDLGEHSRTMIEYFTLRGADACPDDANPAEWVLDVVGAGGGVGAKKAFQDWPQIWRESVNCHDTKVEITRIAQERSHLTNKYESDMRIYAMPPSAQARAVIHRIFISYWRTPEYFAGKLGLHIFTAVFNGITFANLDNSVVAMQNRLFSVFLALTIAPPLTQQLQPRYIAFRALFEGREQKSRMYAPWTFALGSLLVELPYGIISITIYFCCWYFAPGFNNSFSRAGFIWLLLNAFTLYYTSFGIAIAAFSKTELFASIISPVFFTFILLFMGAMVQRALLPQFWESWMFHLTPFRYLFSSLLSTVAHDQRILCKPSDFARFSPPNGQTCAQYVGNLAQQIGGYLNNPTDLTECQYCPYAVGDEYALTFDVFYSKRWRDFGIFCGYIVFNVACVFLFTWLYCGGLVQLRKRLQRNRRS